MAELERQELLKIIPSQVEVIVDDNCTNSFLIEDVCLEKPAGDSLVDIEHESCEAELDALIFGVSMPDEVVDCAIIAPSPFLSEGVISMKDEPPVDAPRETVVELHLLISKVQVECISYIPSFKRSLEEIPLLEFDGAYKDKRWSESMKRRCTQVESTCTTYRSLCSMSRLLKDEWVELWTVHSERFKLLLSCKV